MSSRSEPVRVSIFDLDRTLTRRPTFTAFLIFAALRLAPWRLVLVPALIPFALAYRLRRITRRRLKDAMHATLIGRRRSRIAIEAIARRFAERILAAGLFPQAGERIAAERAAGRLVAIATAAPLAYAGPIGAGLGVEMVVATPFAAEGAGDRIYDANCYGPEKQRRIDAALAATGMSRDALHLRFYSDDLADLPTFDWADEPIAVNPSRRLAEHAVDQGWPILDWRRPD